MNFLDRAWYGGRRWPLLLQPLSMLFRLALPPRRRWLEGRRPLLAGRPPVVVVGNLTVGGAGKTPLVIALMRRLKEEGWRPGAVSRGHGGRPERRPMAVAADSSAARCGDEPVLIAARTGCPVAVDPDRARALACLAATGEVDVVISDDGLQHYRLPRDVEIVVVDGRRLFGNGRCLPAGPLREPVSRLEEADLVVCNGAPARPLPALRDAHVMEIEPVRLVNLATGEERPFEGVPFGAGVRLEAVAGIGDPRRFFDSLDRLSHPRTERAFPDHHPFTEADFAAPDPSRVVVMTEKDAVKCRAFARDSFWCVSTETRLPPALLDALSARLRALTGDACA